jgi:hypothetical protein
VEGILTWLSVAMQAQNTHLDGSSKASIRLRCLDAYTGRALQAPACAELYQLQVVLSGRDVFAHGGAREPQGPVIASQEALVSRRERTAHRHCLEPAGPRQAWAEEARDGATKERGKARKGRSRTPQKRRGRRRGSALRDRAGGEAPLDVDEEARVEGFLSAYLPEEDRRRLVAVGGIGDMLTLLGLDEEDLRDLGVEDEGTRRSIFQGVLQSLRGQFAS